MDKGKSPYIYIYIDIRQVEGLLILLDKQNSNTAIPTKITRIKAMGGSCSSLQHTLYLFIYIFILNRDLSLYRL